MSRQVVVDRELARRLERAEGSACVSFVEQRAKTSPDSGAGWIEVAGAYAAFDGVNSPITQSFGLGLTGMPTELEMDALEAFFRERGADPMFEVSPLAGNQVLGLLTKRGYEPFEFTNVLFLPLPATTMPNLSKLNPDIRCRIIAMEDAEGWVQLAARGWSEQAEYAHFIVEFAQLNVARKGGVSFVAELDHSAIATAALSIHGNVAVLAGASTIPEARNKGAQGALLQARLEYSASVGCDLAMMGAEPGSVSQRNAERNGFRIGYTRIKWRPRRQSP